MLPIRSSSVPRFIELYEGRLSAWAEELQNTHGPIVAIARKGPRLLELLVRYGILPSDFMKCVISERALPFLSGPHQTVVVTDDHLCWGSTFDRIFNLTKSVTRAWQSDAEVLSLPFAINTDASAMYLDSVSKSFLSLKPEEVSSFVNNMMQALKTLGKPYDIEHPAITFSGNFEDAQSFEERLRDVSFGLNGKLVTLKSVIATSSGPLNIHAWTILLQSKMSNEEIPEICKLRIYLNPERDLCTIVSMQPLSFYQDFITEEVSLDPPLNELWRTIFTFESETKETPLSVTRNRSLIMWLNFLNSIPLLRAAKNIFCEEIGEYQDDLLYRGLDEDDLRLLVGPSFARKAVSILEGYITARSSETLSKSLSPSPQPNNLEEKIPQLYQSSYYEELSTLLSKAQSVNEAMQAVFYAQHRRIEIPSRKEDKRDRLEFGITFKKLHNMIFETIPDASDSEIHAVMDRLIDQGSIVPRYMALGDEVNPVWRRVFRVGEGPLEKMLQTVRLLYEKLAAEFQGDATLPRLLFEKYCVLALSVMSDYSKLSPLRELDFAKGFHLYGARMTINVGKEKKFLTDWAVEQGILERGGKIHENENMGDYRLIDLEETYPRNECPWDDAVKDSLEDLAHFVVNISNAKGLKGNALVTLTSLASKVELHKAVEAELHYWLHDKSYSIYHALQAIGELASKANRENLTKRDLNEVNLILQHTANFATQTSEKNKLYQSHQDIFKEIDALVTGDKNDRRIWRDLRKILDSRGVSEKFSSGLDQTLSALRIAYGTNGLLRDLLSHAGYKDPQGREKPLEKSIERLLRIFNNPDKVDVVTKVAFGEKDGMTDVIELLEEAKTELPLDFPEAFKALRPVFSRIAGCCEQILRDFGSEAFRENPQPLEPPKYILMWDVRGSTTAESRELEIDPLVEKINRRIARTFGDRISDFNPDSRDDGHGLVCSKFSDVIAAYKILKDVYRTKHIRAGVEVNMQGRLNYYPRSKALGGRAFEHAARICNLFKEIKTSQSRWNGEHPPEEPDGNYLVVGEFARRFGEEEGSWPPDSLVVNEPEGNYKARINAAIPVSVIICE
jgi:hypothetical protein